MTTLTPFTQRFSVQTGNQAFDVDVCFPSEEQAAANEALILACDDDFAAEYRLRTCIVAWSIGVPFSLALLERSPDALQRLTEIVDGQFAAAEFQ